MNSLSIMIYLAQAGGVLGTGFFLLAAICAVSAFACLMNISDTYRAEALASGDDDEAKVIAREQEKRRTNAKWRGWFIVASLVFGLLGALMPSRNTMLLIAASEIGERTMNNERVQRVVDPSMELLTTWITKMTHDLKREMESQAQGRTR